MVQAANPFRLQINAKIASKEATNNEEFPEAEVGFR
jgi:hypothetical protein